jgi:hypothetical protein
VVRILVGSSANNIKSIINLLLVEFMHNPIFFKGTFLRAQKMRPKRLRPTSNFWPRP